MEDGSWRAVSLDDSFVAYGIQKRAVAVADHKPARVEELELLKGDVLNYLFYWDGNRNGHLNGYFYVLSERLNKKGLVPYFKIKRLSPY
jgi:hypothetical protein